MNVNDLYILWLYLIDKNEQQGYGSPDDFNKTINAGQKNYATYLLGTFQKYTPGRPTANVELGQNSVVRQRLTPIIYGYNLNVDTTGFSPYPGDYMQTDAMWSIYGYNRIRYADQHRFVSMYKSVIDPVATNPIYVIEDVGFRFFPQNIENAFMKYVKDPPNMIWGYTPDVNGIPVYDAARSTQPVWDDVACMEILWRALMMVGINLQIGMVMQAAAEVKNNGQ